MPGPVVLLVALLSAHVPGLSQGDVVVDVVGDAVTVELDVVFARADAARLPERFVVVTAGGAVCSSGVVLGDDVEGDGRALRVQAHCDGDGDLVVDVVGLRALSPDHRLALRVVDDGGTHDFVLSPASSRATLPRPRHPRWPGSSVVVLAVAGVVTAFGARRPRALSSTLGLALIGLGAGLLLRSFAVAPVDGATGAAVAAVVRVIVAALAVMGVVVDPAPRARVSALALAALAAFGP